MIRYQRQIWSIGKQLKSISKIDIIGNGTLESDIHTADSEEILFRLNTVILHVGLETFLT